MAGSRTSGGSGCPITFASSLLISGKKRSGSAANSLVNRRCALTHLAASSGWFLRKRLLHTR